MSDLNTEDVRSDEELDKLADNDVARNSPERPMTEEPEKAAKADAKIKEESYEFTHAGKPIKATREQILKWAQQGYDYPQKMQKINQDKTTWDNQKKEWEKNWGQYKQIDDYAKTNKDWWDHMLKGWQARTSFNPAATAAQTPPGQAVTLPPEVTQKLQFLEQKLSETTGFIDSVQKEREETKARVSDEKLDKDIQSIRSELKDLDWETLNEEGKNLETRILEHAQTSGIPTFRAAARDLLFPDLMARATSIGKIAVAKGVQASTKLGILGQSPNSRQVMPSSNRSMRNTSYEMLEQEAKDELRQGR